MKPTEMLRNNPLPPDFADLAPLVKEWALKTERDRYFKLLATSMDDLRGFYETMLPRADAIVAYLLRLKLNDLPPDARVLYDLMLTFVETAHPIDLKWKQTDIEGGGAPERLRFHGPSATPA